MSNYHVYASLEILFSSTLFETKLMNGILISKSDEKFWKKFVLEYVETIEGWRNVPIKSHIGI